MDDDESSEGDSQRIAMFQKQAKRRYLNKHRAQQESLASLPGYTSQAEAEADAEGGGRGSAAPPKYPPPPAADKYELTAEEADEERDEVGDVVRRVRLRRKRSGSDSYLDSLLARSVHALELSNALLQSTMTTQSSLSALLSRDDQLDSHAQFLAGQLKSKDTSRAWVDDMARQLDPGLSQSLPDAAGGFLAGSSRGGLQHGDRPRSPPPRCMTVYADHTQDPDSILIPSTNGLRSAAQTHGLVVSRSRNHSRQSSVSEDGIIGWGTPPRKRSVSGGGLYGIATASSPQLSTPAPRRASGRRTLSSVHLPPEPSSGYTSSVQSPNVPTTTYSPHSPNITHSPNTSVQTNSNSNQYLSSPVRPILSSVPAEPSTPAYNLLSAIVTRTPGTTTDSESEGRRLAPEPRTRLSTDSRTRLAAAPSDSHSQSRLAPPTDSRLSVDPRVPRIESQISPGLDKRPRHLSENDMGTVRGKGSAGWVAPMMLAGQKRGDSTGGEQGLVRSQSARVGGGDRTPRSGNSSRSGSKPPTPSRTSTNSSVPHRSGSTTSSNPGGIVPSPNRGVRHPFLAGGRRRSISTEDDRALQRYRSADALRKILDDAAAKRRQEEEEEEERARLAAAAAATSEQEPERGRKSLARPNWSVIPRRGTTVAVETVAPAGTVSIEGITGTGGSSGKSSKIVGRQVDPLVLPGEFWSGPVTAEPRSMRQDTLMPARQDTLTPARQDMLTPHPESPTRQRSQSMGPVTRFSSLLPKISVFGKAGIGEPPPTVDKGKGKAVDEDESKAKDIPTSKPDENSRSKTDDLSKTPVAGPSFRPETLSVHLNGALLDHDADTTTSESETESQPSMASLPLPPRLFLDSTDSIRRPSSLRLPESPRPSSFKQPGSGASTPRSVTFSPLPPKHVPSGGRPLSEAKTRRKHKNKEKEKEKPGWFASWFGPLPSSSSSGKYSVSSRRGWDSPRSMDDWQM
ncbi:unnamed protein product [Rhizoctonia solani]|uniref:Uncharacterized protein n=1 Tax=Rhizoctonia solani TaxID=456999 RepID=A0A8H3B1S6_9AGAM|nr:unnamed protein product [Rhizoctonia solani]